MSHSFRKRLFKQFTLFSLALGIPLLLCLVILGNMVPRSIIGTLSATTAAQVAETLSTNLALERISLNPHFSREGHLRQTQPAFLPIANKAKEALVKRSSTDWLKVLLQQKVAENIELLLLAPNGSPDQVRVIASITPDRIGEYIRLGDYQDTRIHTQIIQVVTERQDTNGDGRWTAFSPVFNRAEQTVALVAVHSNSHFMATINWVIGIMALVSVALLVALSSKVAWKLAAKVHTPIENLHQGMVAVAEGELNTKVSPANTGDEFDALITHFNNMCGQLRERVAMQQAMEMAAEIQNKLLPKQTPDIASYDISAYLRYAEFAGGDYYDFIELDEHKGGSKYLLVVGDVTGHGVSAALLVAWLRATIRVLAREFGDDLSALVHALNTSMMKDVDTGKFVTLFLLAVDADSDKFQWLSAGHEPARFYRKGQAEPELLEANGPPVGVVDQASWEVNSPATMHVDDILLIVTDGLQDAKNPLGQRLGMEIVDRTLDSTQALSAPGIQQKLLATFEQHRQGAPLADDITMLLVKGSDTDSTTTKNNEK